ncbi:MAG: hypothetical protein Q8P30_04035 [Candidatus Uhrbacteria bacterium]|nr:hypothetical protein [Candidatus Uhrbacteria bacterium]
MPQSLENPFKEPRKLNPDDAAFIGSVLGPEAEMRRLSGKTAKKAEEPIPEHRFTEEEMEAIRAVEAENIKEKLTRVEVTAYFEDIGLNKEMVEELFEFTEYGEIISLNAELDLYGEGIELIPPFFKRIEGVTRLNLSKNQIPKIENIPDGVTVLNLYNNKIPIEEKVRFKAEWEASGKSRSRLVL